MKVSQILIIKKLGKFNFLLSFQRNEETDSQHKGVIKKVNKGKSILNQTKYNHIATIVKRT
jgi:hypothetical protein